MKKNILKTTLVAAIALVAGMNVYNAQNPEVELSDMALANVEALADCESVFYDTGMQRYSAENGCHCLSCCEVAATNCNCR